MKIEDHKIASRTWTRNLGKQKKNSSNKTITIGKAATQHVYKHTDTSEATETSYRPKVLLWLAQGLPLHESFLKVRVTYIVHHVGSSDADWHRKALAH